jgi:hypothetical protein
MKNLFMVTRVLRSAAGTITLEVPLWGGDIHEVVDAARTKSWDEMLDYLRVHGRPSNVSVTLLETA